MVNLQKKVDAFTGPAIALRLCSQNPCASKRETCYDIDQGWATSGPRENFVQSVNTFETSVNLSYDDKRETNAVGKSQKVYKS